jgi:radical SAM superfamily enzyme YgiQ (UPF0313 family)
LTEAGAVLLISSYELGHQPLNLASPVAHLKRAGFAPATIDASVEELDAEKLRAARLIAISVPMHTALRLGVRVAERVRAVNPRAHVCFYGLYATLNGDYLLNGLGDSVIGGEYEGALVELARALDVGALVRAIVGVGTRERTAAPVLERLAPVVVDRSSLPGQRRYAGLERDGTIVRAGYVEATRGCHHTCGHCPITPIYGGKFFAVPHETVLADARTQVRAGARHVTFGDPDFFNGPGHGLRICRTLHEEFPGLTFDATIKIEHILQHRRFIPELVELGCVFVVSAVESLSDLVLAKLSKGHTKANVFGALTILDEVGLPMRPSLLPFTPWATLEDYLELLTFVGANDLQEHVDPVHFSIRLLVPPGSALLCDPSSADWVGDLDQAAFTYRWRHADPRMDELQAEVARIVEAVASKGEEARVTYARVWDVAHRTGGSEPPILPRPAARRRRPPRLTESWFC